VVAIDEVHSTSESRAYITVCIWGRVVELRQKTHSLHGASYKDHRRSEQMCKFFASHLASLPLSSSRQSMWLVSWLSMFLLRGKMVLCESISAKLGKSPKEWQEALRPLLPSSCTRANVPLQSFESPQRSGRILGDTLPRKPIFSSRDVLDSAAVASRLAQRRPRRRGYHARCGNVLTSTRAHQHNCYIHNCRKLIDLDSHANSDRQLSRWSPKVPLA
jgi:hypothetical protein